MNHGEQQSALALVAFAVAQGERVYVIAPTFQQFEAWRRIHLLLYSPHQLRYVFGPSALRGAMKPRYIVVNGFPRDDGRMRQELEITGAVCLGHFDY